MSTAISSSDLLPDSPPPNAVIRNYFTGLVATPDQHYYSLLNFRQIGQEDVDMFVKYVYLNSSSVKPTSHYTKLKTFSSKKLRKSSLAKLTKEKTLVTKCLQNRLLWSRIDPDTKPELGHEQYLELPRAIADCNGIPNKGSKSNTTKKRYNDVIITRFPHGWFPDVFISEGMFD